MSQPTVSVVIPTHNRAQYIGETIQSVLAQTYADYEIIVVDDRSTDNTGEIIQSLSQERDIRYFSQPCGSAPAARNYGLQQAQGKYIAFLDSDDLFMPEKLGKQVTFLDEHASVALVHTGYEKFSDDGEDLGYRDTSKITGKYYHAMLLDWSVLIATPCVLVRKVVLDEVGDFDETMRAAEDLDLWRRIAQRYEIGVIPEMLCRVRVHAGSLSTGKVEAAASFEHYLAKAFKDDPSLSMGFQRRAFGRLYSNIGHNILAEGRAEEMPFVRTFSARAIQQWPFQGSAYLGFLGSFIPLSFRDRLLIIWRRFRYNRK
jgi:glycosyltransferase involved in cell wall biosynthesis